MLATRIREETRMPIGGFVMRRLPIIWVSFAVVLVAASVSGQTLDPRPEIDFLARVVAQMSDQAAGGGASLSTKQQARLKLLLGEQRSKLERLKARYSQDQVRIT